MPDFSGGEFLNEIFQSDPRLGTLLQGMINATNNSSRSAGVAPVGQVSAPPPIDSVNVAQAGEMLHVSLNHNSQINRGIQYFTEVSTNPQFTQIVAAHAHGTSRTSAPFSLPTKDSTGANHNYYLRSYAQYPGGPPSSHTVYGGSSSPTAITMSGSTQLNLLSSTGTGTSPANGQSAGQGFGKFSTRPATGPKRQV